MIFSGDGHLSVVGGHDEGRMQLRNGRLNDRFQNLKRHCIKLRYMRKFHRFRTKYFKAITFHINIIRYHAIIRDNWSG